MYLWQYTHSNNRNKTGLNIPLDTTNLQDKNEMLSEKASAEKLCDNNKKRLQKIIGKFLYYDRVVDPTMLMALKSLAAMHTKPTIETAKQVTEILNYRATYKIQYQKTEEAELLYIFIWMHPTFKNQSTKHIWWIFFLRNKIQHNNTIKPPLKLAQYM